MHLVSIFHWHNFALRSSNSSCEWLISADTGYVVRLTLLLVDLQESDTSDCPFNRLTIYDGTTTSLSSSHPPFSSSIYSSFSDMFLLLSFLLSTLLFLYLFLVIVL